MHTLHPQPRPKATPRQVVVESLEGGTKALALRVGERLPVPVEAPGPLVG